MQKIVLILCFFSFLQNVFTQNNYILFDMTEKSDLIQNLKFSLDTSDKNDLLETIFKPVKGEFKIYRFIESYYGESPKYLPDSTVIELLNDLLVLVVNKKNQIVDGYQYSLEYAEHPSSCDLYRLDTDMKLTIDSNFKLSSLKFRLMNDSKYCGRDLYIYFSQLNLFENKVLKY